MLKFNLINLLFIAFTCFLLISQKSIAQDIQALDSQYGFFEVKLGAKLDTINHHFSYKGKSRKKDRYILNNPIVKEYAGIKLEETYFDFYKSRLHSIQIKIKGEKESEQFLSLLQMYYGEGEQDGMAPHYIWDGKRVYLEYDQNLLTKNSLIVFTSKEMQNLFSKEWRERWEY